MVHSCLYKTVFRISCYFQPPLDMFSHQNSFSILYMYIYTDKLHVQTYITLVLLMSRCIHNVTNGLILNLQSPIPKMSTTFLMSCHGHQVMVIAVLVYHFFDNKLAEVHDDLQQIVFVYFFVHNAGLLRPLQENGIQNDYLYIRYTHL